MPKANGFTLVEVLVALILVAIMAAGIAGVFSVAASDVRDARAETIAAVSAAQKLAQLRALRWEDLAAADAGADTLDHNVAGYSDFLDVGGGSIGTAGAGSARAVYVRRWSVQRLSNDPNNSLVLRVFVASAASAREGVATERRTGRAGQVLLVTVRTRASP